MAIITIVGAGMMGSALAFPARENGNEVRLVGTHLDREIIEKCIKCDKHPKFTKAFPSGVKYYQIEALEEAIEGADMVIGGVSSFGVDWFGDFVLPKIPDTTPILTVTKGLMDTEDGRLLTWNFCVVLCLCMPQFSIFPMTMKQFFMAAVFDDLTLIKYKDMIAKTAGR